MTVEECCFVPMKIEFGKRVEVPIDFFHPVELFSKLSTDSEAQSMPTFARTRSRFAEFRPIRFLLVKFPVLSGTWRTGSTIVRCAQARVYLSECISCLFHLSPVFPTIEVLRTRPPSLVKAGRDVSGADPRKCLLRSEFLPRLCLFHFSYHVFNGCPLNCNWIAFPDGCGTVKKFTRALWWLFKFFDFLTLPLPRYPVSLWTWVTLLLFGEECFYYFIIWTFSYQLFLLFEVSFTNFPYVKRPNIFTGWWLI